MHPLATLLHSPFFFFLFSSDGVNDLSKINGLSPSSHSGSDKDKGEQESRPLSFTQAEAPAPGKGTTPDDDAPRECADTAEAGDRGRGDHPRRNSLARNRFYEKNSFGLNCRTKVKKYQLQACKYWFL
jgi:hypothetical protein